MEKKVYEAPQLQHLGTVQELTALVAPPTACSALPPDFSTEDALCEISNP